MAAFPLQQDHPLEASLPLIVQVELSDKRYGCRRYPATAGDTQPLQETPSRCSERQVLQQQQKGSGEQETGSR